MNPVRERTQQARRRDAALRMMMRVFGLVLALWASFLLTRDFVLSGEMALWFVAATAGLGVFSFAASWWRPQARRQRARAPKGPWAGASS